MVPGASTPPGSGITLREVVRVSKDLLFVVRGRTVTTVQGRTVRERAEAATRVVVDLGAGDGRWLYRLARAHPDWCCLALDASAESLREVSRRAARAAGRGGASNAWFLRAAVDALPAALDGLADEVHVHFPWGRLLEVLLRPEVDVLVGIAGMARDSAALCVRVNLSVLGLPAVCRRLDLPPAGHQNLEARLRAGYAAAGLHLAAVRQVTRVPDTSWGRRLSSGRPLPELAIEAHVAAGGAGLPVRGKMVPMRRVHHR